MSFLEELQSLRIPFIDIEEATKKFTNCIGKGGYGFVYRGELLISDKLTTVAVKRLNSNVSGQGFKEFLTEIQLLTRCKHPNLVSLIGFCDQDNEKILIYEYAEYGSLEKYLSNVESRSKLTWKRRINICVNAARGLNYLHNEVATNERVIHRDIKSANVLLDQNWNAMISDLGLSKLGRANEQHTFLITNVSGTHGYCDPAYIDSGILTKESDVYSFGVVLFEVLCGRLCFLDVNNDHRFLPSLARRHCKIGKIDEIMDPTLKNQIDSDSLNKFSKIASQCLLNNRKRRPSMRTVVKKLEEVEKASELQYLTQQEDTEELLDETQEGMDGPSPNGTTKLKRSLDDMLNNLLLSSTVKTKKRVDDTHTSHSMQRGSLSKADEVEHVLKPEIAEFIEKTSDFEEENSMMPVSITSTSKQEDVPLVTEASGGTKSGKLIVKGVSMTELFTPEQVREHITGLRQWVGQSKAKVENNQAMQFAMNENSCQLCAVEKLNFEPPPIYCSPCSARIKINAIFFTIGSGDTRHYFCAPCYIETREDTVSVYGTNIPKANLENKKNDEETEEWWVRCDKCEAWQHQICALFNGRRNDGGQAEYICPNCYVEEVERGERVPLPQSAVLGAQDLPTTNLSDHIEDRLFKRLEQERSERARFHGKSYDEVPGAESLVVRVVSSVDKKLEVKQRFLEIFQEENYPPEFAYKSKVVLLFQKIEGVEVCLFGMYVQEFGAECQQPNSRRVYISHIDSVKYFRPEITTVTGEALRTFVYHEILIGYLEYCKLRGFTSCCIWACPPLKGEDYILYCHPEIQMTPKSDKLREWFLSMLRKASNERIVVELTNLYDHFFVSSGECEAKVTAARLPYFDGDYWPGAAEDIIYQLNQEEDGRKHKKGSMKRTITKRDFTATGQTDLSSNASKDLLLMHRLGETIFPMKENFIMVHLQHSCTHCCLLMVFGTRWVCNSCNNFQLCNRCYQIEQTLEKRERHPINQRLKHPLHPVKIDDVATDTKDKDEIIESEFFDTRQAFLSLCQGNHYQYDTLRRAKHSSMMTLYHLHNATAPVFVINCVACRLDTEAALCWHCEICPYYDLCNSCYRKDRGNDHPHKLTHNFSTSERDAQTKEARQWRIVQLRNMLDLLVHASQCRSQQCQYPNCRKVKRLYRHGKQCKVRASGGCPLCKNLWYILQLHARSCKDIPCLIPRCRDVREHLKGQTQQADIRQRAAVIEMTRQRLHRLREAVDDHM